MPTCQRHRWEWLQDSTCLGENGLSIGRGQVSYNILTMENILWLPAARGISQMYMCHHKAWGHAPGDTHRATCHLISFTSSKHHTTMVC